MRVISGSLGGRSFDSPKGHRTHPMSDKVRGAIFNMLGDLEGLTVLDAFAGSGALGIEAISRGASQAVAIDSDTSAHQTILQNLEALGLKNRLRAVRQNVVTWSRDNAERQFDVVLADPPYDDLRPAYITQLATNVQDGGLLVLSWPGGQEVPEIGSDLTIIGQKSYGDAQVIIYRRS